jgi:hypothetical protein
MPETIFWAMLVVFPLAGILLRRWGVLLAPVIAWPVFAIGFWQDWWGDKGDGWQYVFASAWLFNIVTTAGAILAAIAVTQNRVKPPVPTN